MCLHGDLDCAAVSWSKAGRQCDMYESIALDQAPLAVVGDGKAGWETFVCRGTSNSGCADPAAEHMLSSGVVGCDGSWATPGILLWGETCSSKGFTLAQPCY